MGNIVRIFALTVAFICLVIVACVGSLAIFYSNLSSALRPIAGGGFALVAMILIFSGLRKGKSGAWAAFLVLFVMVIHGRPDRLVLIEPMPLNHLSVKHLLNEQYN